MTPLELPKPNDWQELVIEQFETSVDTEAFGAVVEQHKVRDDTVVKVDRISVPNVLLPTIMTDVYAYPGRLEIEDFVAHLSRSFPICGEDGDILPSSVLEEELWTLHAMFTANDQPFKFTATPLETAMKTTGHRGQELRGTFEPDTMGHFLASLISAQMKLAPDVALPLQSTQYSAGVDVLQRLLLTMGQASTDAVSSRERLVWLPQATQMRTLCIKFDEMETSSRSGRKLSYRLAWKPDEMLASDISAYQTEYSSSDTPPTFYSTRTTLDCEPHELLETQAIEELTDEFKVGAYFDPDLNRAEHASVVATIKPVLDMYLSRYAYLDVAALDAILRSDKEI